MFKYLSSLILGRRVIGVDWQLIGAVDGDTIAFRAPKLPPKIQKISVRVLGVDTPESNFRALSDAELAHGKRAKAFTAARLKAARVVQVDITGWDKYGGRALGKIKLDGKCLASLLIEHGYAVAYDGGKKSDWAKLLKKGQKKQKTTNRKKYFYLFIIILLTLILFSYNIITSQ
jgi:micrococcal nuclease